MEKDEESGLRYAYNEKTSKTKRLSDSEEESSSREDEGWEEAVDKETGKVYVDLAGTGQTQGDAPDE